MWQKWHFKCPLLLSPVEFWKGVIPGVLVPWYAGLPLPFMEPLPFMAPFPLPLGFPFPFPWLGEDEDLPLPFGLPFEPLPFELGVYAAWYGPGDIKLVAGSCKYDHARWLGCEVFCLFVFPSPPFIGGLANWGIITWRSDLVFKYFKILGWSAGEYFFVKLITFWANSLTSSENRNMSLRMFTAVKVACNVAIISFSSSVIYRSFR